jgi:hypothetical protein
VTLALAQVVVTYSSAEARSPVVQRRAQITCSEPGDPVSLSSVDQVARLAVGTWIRCEGPPVFGQVAVGDVGMEVDVDGHFYRVFDAGDGTLLRADGLDQEGTWELIDTSGVNGPGSYQMNWKALGSGTVITSVRMFESPPSLGLNESRGSARYERWTGSAPVPGLPPGVGEGRCGHPTGVVTPSSVDQTRDLLVGVWTRCGEQSVVVNPAGEVGLEITADGHFYELARSADGTTTRLVGDGQTGVWTIIDTTAMNGPGSYQLDLQIAGQGMRTGQPVFLASPPFVRFVGIDMGVGQGNADYLRGEPPTGFPRTGNGTIATLLISAVLATSLGLAMQVLSRKPRSKWVS